MKGIDTLGKNVYLVGIKGAGMAGLAQILKGLCLRSTHSSSERGFRVEGSDIPDSFFTDDILRRQGIPFYEGFDVKNIPDDIDWAVSSAAYLGAASSFQLLASSFDNPEIKLLKERGVPIFEYAEVLARFFNQAYGIAVTGTHGKSTTAGMVAYILAEAGKDPFALVGGELLNWHSNARIPKNPKPLTLNPKPYFVIEADEYREQFLHYKPSVLVITNIDYDHPDYFATKKDYHRAFEKFKKQVKPGGVTIESKNLELPAFAKASAGRHVTPKESPEQIPSELYGAGKLPTGQTRYTLHVIGDHNQQNAHLAYKTCRRLGIEHRTILEALKKFKGLRRRLEKIGEYNGAIIIDDYAHHPAEIVASLRALKESYLFHDRRKGDIVVLFHPHTYSRTETFLKEFAKALTLADEIYLLDIYASAREKRGKVSSDNIVQEIQNLGRDAINLHTIENAVEYFRKHLKKGDIFVTMGAGDVFRVAEQLTRSI